MSREPQRDWRSEVARLDTSASHENLSTQVSIFRFILRVIFLPVWLPFYFYGMAKRRREMREFVLARAKNRVVDAALINEIALVWAEARPEEYPLGEYDPGLGKLRSRFRRIIESDRR
ncbi:MAG: hypothetical protein F4Y44_06365 [Chloroflexi bacterium]|nr:hypothetical protein [Chloroflexota bacterium]